MSEKLAIGIDLGGTNIMVALVTDDGRITKTSDRRTLPDRGAEAVMDDMSDMVTELVDGGGISRDDIIGLGIGTPGPLSHRDGIIYRSANLPGWKDVHIRRGLLERTGIPTILDNDANIAAFGEYWAGAGKGSRDMVAITLGTGIGSGVIAGGEMLRGHYENAAEFGHTIIHPGGRLCPCGQRGCVEQYCSPGNVAKHAMELIRQGSESSLADVLDEKGEFGMKAISEAAQEGDELSLRLWDEACYYIALSCVNIQHTYNPETLVLAGGMTKSGDFLLSRVLKHFDEQRWNLMDDAPELRIAALGNDAGVIGAAGLAWAARNSNLFA